MSKFSDPSYTSKEYALLRPTYPLELYDTITDFMGVKKEHLKGSGRVVVDVGTGTGQAAVALAQIFDRVIAVDPSARQLEFATPAPNIEYRLSRGEELDFAPDGSVDLVTIAQALHWLDHDRFFKEVDRVLKPGGVIAMWGYMDDFDDPALAAILTNLARHTLAECWDKGVHIINDRYETVTPPYPRFLRKSFRVHMPFTIERYMALLHTWSAYQTFRQRHPDRPDPLVQVKRDIMDALHLNTSTDELVVRFDFFALCAQKPELK